VKLKKNERLAVAGEIEIRAPDGTTRRTPQYIIVTDADPTANPVTVGENERVHMIAHVFRDRRRAEERFEAMKAGREMPPKEDGTPLYIITDAANINPKTGLSREDEQACAALGKDIAALIAIHTRKTRAFGNFKTGPATIKRGV